MIDRSKLLLLAALVLLVVALSGLNISFVPLSIGGRHVLPWIVVGIIVLFLLRNGCCWGSCHRGDDGAET